MSYLVNGATCKASFNEDINSWETGQVTTMVSMFYVRSGRSPISHHLYVLFAQARLVPSYRVPPCGRVPNYSTRT